MKFKYFLLFSLYIYIYSETPKSKFEEFTQAASKESYIKFRSPDSSIIKGTSNKRKYRYLELSNEMKVVLVQDTETASSGGALGVLAGANLDKHYAPGIAHFCEHMQFQGSKKYPTYNEMFDYIIKQFGGNMNAFTAPDMTVHHFEAPTRALEGGLERFADALLNPLMEEINIKKETAIVHSEFIRSINSDDYRLLNLLRMNSNPQGSYHSMICGNNETLSYESVQKDLIDYYTKYYSSNLLALVIYSNLSFNELEDLVVKNFGQIENKNLQKPDYSNPKPNESPYVGRLFKVDSYSDKKVLYLFWYFGYLGYLFKHQPYYYSINILSHKGPNSLFSYLKEENLVLNIEAGCSHEKPARSICYLEITLSLKGVENYTRVIEIIFGHLKHMKENDINTKLLQEDIYMSKLRFHNKHIGSIMDYAAQLVKNVFYYPFEYIESVDFMRESADLELIKIYTKKFGSENLDIFVCAKNITQGKESLKDKYYGTNYQMTNFSKELTEIMNNPNVNNVSFPSSNEFIDINAKAIQQENQLEEEDNINPILLKADMNGEIWHSENTQFNTSSSYIRLAIYTKDLDLNIASAEGQVFLNLYIRIFNDYFEEALYMVKKVGHKLSLTSENNHLLLKISGLFDPIKILNIFAPKLLELDSAKMQNIFTKQLEEYIKKLENKLILSPIQVASKLTQSIIQTNKFSPDILLVPARAFTFEKFSISLKKWLQTIRYRVLITGKVNKGKSQQLISDVNTVLKGDPLNKEDISEMQTVKLEEKTFSIILKMAESKEEENSCLLSYFQFEKRNFKSIAIFQILAQHLGEEVFSELRTREEIGYVAGFTNGELGQILGGIFYIESPTFSPAYIHQKLDSFIFNFYIQLKTIDETDIAETRDNLIIKLKDKDINLRKQTDRYWKNIMEGDANFDFNIQIAEAMANIQKSDVVHFFEEHFIINIKRLDVQILSHKHSKQEIIFEENKKKMEEKGMQFIEIKGIEDWQSTKQLYPDYNKDNYLHTE